MKKAAIKRPRVALITAESFATPSALEIHLKLLHLLAPLCCDVDWVATNCTADAGRLPGNVKAKTLNEPGSTSRSFIIRLFSAFIQELRVVAELTRLRVADIFVFYYGYPPLLSILYATLVLRQKVALRLDGRSSRLLLQNERAGPWRRIRAFCVSLLERAGYGLADRILVEYESMVSRFDMQKYAAKIQRGNLQVDTQLFRPTCKLEDRTYDLGYCGRLSPEKGVVEFAHSVCALVKAVPRYRVIVIGDGSMRSRMTEILAAGGAATAVDFVGWVDRAKTAEYLNQTRLIIVPSYREGLPNTVLEAMACGTPVAATDVGGIPDVIIDGKTGFIMDSNSPDSIERCVARALAHPDLAGIGKAACELIHRDFNYDVTLERYRKALNSLLIGSTEVPDAI